MPVFRIPLVLALLISLCAPLSSALDEGEVITDFLWQKTVALSPPRRPKVALVLGGGGARGLAHIGVLKVLAEEKVPVDMIVGTSVGALVGAMYAAGVPLERIETLGENIRWNKITNLSRTSLLRLLMSERLLSTAALEKYLTSTIGKKRFDELKIPYACVAADIMTGERVILREGDVGVAARASATIPGVFDPVAYRHRLLIDGGLVDNIPTDVARILGADVIIAVAVSSDFSQNRLNNVFMMLTQSLYIQGRQLEGEKLKMADLVIRPKVNDVTVVELDRSRDCIDQGVLAARTMMPAIKRFLIGKVSDEDLLP